MSPTVNMTTGVAFSGVITATGATLAKSPNDNLWELASGAIPDGLDFTDGIFTGLPFFSQSPSITLTGTPTVAATFNFSIRCTTPTKDAQTKAYTALVAAPPNPCATLASPIYCADGAAWVNSIKTAGPTDSPILVGSGGSWTNSVSIVTIGNIDGTGQIGLKFIFTYTFFTATVILINDPAHPDCVLGAYTVYFDPDGFAPPAPFHITQTP